jgi:hypothetical protein
MINYVLCILELHAHVYHHAYGDVLITRSQVIAGELLSVFLGQRIAD